MIISFRKFAAVSIVTVFGMACQQAYADRGDLSFGLKYSIPQPDSFSVEGTNIDLDGDSGFSVSLGYEYDDNWTIQLEYITSESEDTDTAGNPPIKAETTGFGLYGVYRTAQSIGAPYFFGRLGFGSTEVKLTQTGFAGVTADDSGLAFGAGAGYRYSDNLSLELEYFVEDQDFSHILIGVRYMLGSGI